MVKKGENMPQVFKSQVGESVSVASCVRLDRSGHKENDLLYEGPDILEEMETSVDTQVVSMVLAGLVQLSSK